LGEREQKVLDILDTLQPDIIFLTGDYVAWNGDYEPALKFLSKMHAKIGIWAVMGDHDYSNSRKSCLFCHEEGTGKTSRRHSVRFLRDNLEVLNLPEGPIVLAGTDIEQVTSPENLKVWSVLKHKHMPAIVLSHSPLAFDVISDNQNLLVLAGDTHGGQVPVPAWVFSVMGYKKNAMYSQGLFERRGNRLFVSRGIGTSHIPVRLFRQPEVVVLHFVP
jgi:predicted MPP superfamily phosphohydrolase